MERIPTSVLKSSINRRKSYTLIASSNDGAKKGRDHLYKFNRQNGKNYSHEQGYFTMPAKRIKEFGLDVGTCHKRAFKELEENGFIEVIENNRLRHKENIYKLSTKWKKLEN